MRGHDVSFVRSTFQPHVEVRFPYVGLVQIHAMSAHQLSHETKLESAEGGAVSAPTAPRKPGVVADDDGAVRAPDVARVPWNGYVLEAHALQP